MLANRTQIMILGTYHMHNPNLDYMKTNYADVLAEPRQEQIRELVKRLESFAPSHVAVEVLPEEIARLNHCFQRYLEGDYPLSRNEIDQVAFRLAQVMGHRQLYGIDHQQDLDFDGVFKYIEAHGLADLKAEIDRELAEMNARQQSIEAEGTIVDLVRYMNSQSHDDHHQIYLRSTLVGAGETWVGADMTANWYARNLKMYANILKLAQRPEDRILVLVGAGHAPLLREFLRQTPQIELIHPEQYLS